MVQSETGFLLHKDVSIILRAPTDGALKNRYHSYCDNGYNMLFNFTSSAQSLLHRTAVYVWQKAQWLFLANLRKDVYNTVSDSRSWAKRGTGLKHKRQFQLVPATGPLEFVTMDIWGPLSGKTKRNQNGFAIADRCCELVRTFPRVQITTTNVTCIFFYEWSIPYGKPTKVLTGNGTQFTDKSFATLCAHFGAKKLAKTRTTHSRIGMLNNTTFQL